MHNEHAAQAGNRRLRISVAEGKVTAVVSERRTVPYVPATGQLRAAKPHLRNRTRDEWIVTGRFAMSEDAFKAEMIRWAGSGVENLDDIGANMLLWIESGVRA
jgi:hypothetical protein